jgi:hypothetical protein
VQSPFGRPIPPRCKSPLPDARTSRTKFFYTGAGPRKCKKPPFDHYEVSGCKRIRLCKFGLRVLLILKTFLYIYDIYTMIFEI